MRGFIDGEYQDGEVRGRMFVGGASGYGKTTEVQRLIDQCEGGAVFFDVTGRHSLSGGVDVHEPGALIRALTWYVTNGQERFRIVYQPFSGDIMTHFRECARTVDQFAALTFAIDEVDTFCGAEWGDSRMPPELYKLAHFGRHSGRAWGDKRRGVALMYTARIPTSVARALTSQAYEMRLFHEHESSYLHYYGKGPLGMDNAEKLKALQKFEYYVWHNDGQPMRLAGGARKEVR